MMRVDASMGLLYGLNWLPRAYMGDYFVDIQF